MLKNIPIFKLDVSMDDPESGVSFVALVDDPAIQKNFMAFDADKPALQFKTTNEEKRIVSGPLMVADMPIYRNDESGEYYVLFTANSIENVVKKFFKERNTSNVNEMHDPSKIMDGVYMFESFLIDRGRMSPPTGFDDLTDGSWFGSYKVENDAVWSQIKAGDFKGFSVEGHFIPKQDSPDEALLKEIQKIIAQN